jgi:uncharacterized membrane protein
MSESTANTRLEAFSDGVFAIALTLLIIDIKLPTGMEINTTAQFWLALKHTLPSISAFILSFVIILITWVNHHNGARLLNRSSAAFIYSNGLLLLTVVFLPFPTSLIGEYILTDHAAPAVVLYNATIVIQSLAWILICSSSIKHKLLKNEKSIGQMQLNLKSGYFAFAMYSVLTVGAVWYPIPVAVITVLLWIFWLIFGINIKEE